MAKSNRNRLSKNTLIQILGATEAVEEKQATLGSRNGIKLVTGARIVRRPAGSGYNYFIEGGAEARGTTIAMIREHNYDLLPAGGGPMTESHTTTPVAATSDAPTPLEAETVGT